MSVRAVALVVGVALCARPLHDALVVGSLDPAEAATRLVVVLAVTWVAAGAVHALLRGYVEAAARQNGPEDMRRGDAGTEDPRYGRRREDLPGATEAMPTS